MSSNTADAHVLSQKLGGGPHGLGDPNDRTLRKVEKEVLIPKIMRDLAKAQKCTAAVADFEACCKDSGVLMAFKCRPQNEALRDCQTRWYKDEQFISECTEVYLKKRAEYRRTGLTVKQRERLAQLAPPSPSAANAI